MTVRGGQFPGVHVEAGNAGGGAYDPAVTSLGMKGDDELPMSHEIVEASVLIAECVCLIAPEMTRLLEIARKKGRAIHTGVPMLAAQMELMLRFMGVE
jgi:shikimate dehydrogenase